jgi:uncharacterized protein with HEPN domain
MSTRSWQQRIADILDAIAEIQVFCSDLSFDAFLDDPKTLKAVVADLTIIGEAVRHIPDEVMDAHENIPWALIRGMRNRIVHDYYDVDPAIVWDTVQNDLHPLIPPLQALLREAGA